MRAYECDVCRHLVFFENTSCLTCGANLGFAPDRQAVVALAQAFGLQTVAEGVEDAATLQLLRALGVDFAQGYHIARPRPVEQPVTSAIPVAAV